MESKKSDFDAETPPTDLTPTNRNRTGDTQISNNHYSLMLYQLSYDREGIYS